MSEQKKQKHFLLKIAAAGVGVAIAGSATTACSATSGIFVNDAGKDDADGGPRIDAGITIDDAAQDAPGDDASDDGGD